MFSDINVYVSESNKDRKKLRDNMSSCGAKSNKDVGGEDRKTCEKTQWRQQDRKTHQMLSLNRTPLKDFLFKGGLLHRIKLSVCQATWTAIPVPGN